MFNMASETKISPSFFTNFTTNFSQSDHNITNSKTEVIIFDYNLNTHFGFNIKKNFESSLNT